MKMICKTYRNGNLIMEREIEQIQDSKILHSLCVNFGLSERTGKAAMLAIANKWNKIGLNNGILNIYTVE